VPAARLIEIPGLLHDLDIGTETDLSDTNPSILRNLKVLAIEANRLPWQGPIGDHIAAGASVTIAARLSAFLLPRADSSILRFGIIPIEAWGNESLLFNVLVRSAQQLGTVSEHLQTLINDTAEGWVDPQVIAGDVADIHDLASGYHTASRLLCALGVTDLSRGIFEI
jgi:hypothetical protein